MSSKAKKSKTEIERQMEMESARIFGKHVSKEKAVVLYAVTLAACAMPMLMGMSTHCLVFRHSSSPHVFNAS